MIVLCYLLSFLSFSLCAPPAEIVLVASSGKQNCSRVCRRVSLECDMDNVDLRTMNEDFLKEFFTLSGYDSYCTYSTSARSRADMPYFLPSSRTCQGYKHGTSQLATCDQTSHVNYASRTLCICKGFTNFAAQGGYMRSRWEFLREPDGLTSGYYRPLSPTNDYTWSAGGLGCHDEIAQMPAVRSQQENDILQQYALSNFGNNTHVWLYEKTSGRYWEDARQHKTSTTYYGPWPYVNFSSGYPTGTSYCTYMNTFDGLWYTKSCSQTAKVICQLNFFVWWTTAWSHFTSEKDIALSGAVLGTEPAANLGQCAKLCRRDVQCLSANFEIQTGDCTMYPRLGKVHRDEMSSYNGTFYIERKIFYRFPEDKEY